MSGIRPLTVSGLSAEFPSGRDQLPPQERRDQKPVVPALQQAPGAGDRDIGKHRNRRQTAGLPL